MSSEARIAISGKSGCGNSTVTRLVGERLGLRIINYTFRDMAAEMGISFEELRARAELDDRFDRDLDRKQVELALGRGCVLGSRLAIWLIGDADFKVYLDGSPEVRAARIAKREGTAYEETLRKTTLRDTSDRQRYLNLYGIDIDEYGFADLVVETSRGDQHYVADTVLEAFERRASGG